MNNIYDFYENQPHIVSEVICLKCLNRWICVYPEKVLLKELFCDYCEQTGFIIGTGQILEE